MIIDRKMSKEILLLVTILLVAIIAVLHFTPRKVFLDQSSVIVLQSYCGKYKTIPLKEINSVENDTALPNDLIRTMGTKVGKRASGCFYSNKRREKYYLFVTGKCNLTSFTFEGKHFIVDSWEDINP